MVIFVNTGARPLIIQNENKSFKIMFILVLTLQKNNNMVIVGICTGFFVGT